IVIVGNTVGCSASFGRDLARRALPVLTGFRRYCGNRRHRLVIAPSAPLAPAPGAAALLLALRLLVPVSVEGLGRLFVDLLIVAFDIGRLGQRLGRQACRQSRAIRTQPLEPK